MDFMGWGMLVVLGAYLVGSIILSIPIYYLFFLLLMLLLDRKRLKPKNGHKRVFSNVHILIYSLILASVAAVVFPLPRISYIPYVYRILKYQFGSVPTTYPYAKIQNVVNTITPEQAIITFDLTVIHSGQYTVKGEFPCYKQISPPTQYKYNIPQSYPIDLKAGKPEPLTFSFVHLEDNNVTCRNKFFEFILNPREPRLFDKDNYVIFTGFLSRIRSAGADQESRHAPYVYIPEFNFDFKK